MKKVFTAKLDAGGGAAAAGGGGRTKTSTPEKSSKAGAPQKTARSASTTGETTTGKSTTEPSQLQLLTVQQPGQHSRSVSPRTPSTADGGESSSGRVPSNTESSSIGLDAADRTLAGK